MANVPTVVVGTGNQKKVVTPALLTGLDSSGNIVPLKVDASGNLLTSGGSQLTGQGDPNTANVSGQRGWIYQDLNYGDLFVYGETTGPDAWLPVLVDRGSAPGGMDGQIFTKDGGYPIWSYGINTAGVEMMGWGPNSGLFVTCTTDGFMSAGFDNRTLNAGEETVYNWSDNIIYDWIQATESADFNNRMLRDATAVLSVNWGNRSLHSSGGFENLLHSASSVLLVAPVGSEGPKLYNSSLTNAAAPICGFNTQTFEPSIQAINTTTTNNSTTATLQTATTLPIGTTVTGSGIPAGTTITNKTGNTLTLSNAATSTGTRSLDYVVPVVLATTSGNNILVAIQGTGTIGSLAVHLLSMLNNQPSTEAIIYIHSSRAITTLKLTYSENIQNPEYTFTGTAITNLAANGTHVLRRSGTVLYHVQ
jgi:hypothetical protein